MSLITKKERWIKCYLYDREDGATLSIPYKGHTTKAINYVKSKGYVKTNTIVERSSLDPSKIRVV